MEDFIEGLEGIQQEYKREYLDKRLNVVTTMRDVIGDDCGGYKRVAVVKHYTVKPKEYYTERHYNKHQGTTYQKYVKDIPPRKFYRESELRAYIGLLNKMAGRTIENDELTLLLRYITSGRHYQLVCLVDITEQLKRETVWEDIKG